MPRQRLPWTFEWTSKETREIENAFSVAYISFNFHGAPMLSERSSSSARWVSRESRPRRKRDAAVPPTFLRETSRPRHVYVTRARPRRYNENCAAAPNSTRAGREWPGGASDATRCKRCMHEQIGSREGERQKARGRRGERAPSVQPIYSTLRFRSRLSIFSRARKADWLAGRFVRSAHRGT